MSRRHEGTEDNSTETHHLSSKPIFWVLLKAMPGQLLLRSRRQAGHDDGRKKKLGKNQLWTLTARWKGRDAKRQEMMSVSCCRHSSGCRQSVWCTWVYVVHIEVEAQNDTKVAYIRFLVTRRNETDISIPPSRETHNTHWCWGLQIGFKMKEHFHN